MTSIKSNLNGIINAVHTIDCNTDHKKEMKNIILNNVRSIRKEMKNMTKLNSNLTNPEIEKTLMVSTAHITSNDDEILKHMKDSINTNNIIESKEWFYRIRITHDTTTFQESFDEFVKRGLSENFTLLLVHALVLECSWLQVDCDGPEYPELKKFDW